MLVLSSVSYNWPNWPVCECQSTSVQQDVADLTAMDGSDDIDEDELALAMSTELSRPTRTVALRRAHSVTSLRDTEVPSRVSRILLI
jgi:hypothetical protein